MKVACDTLWLPKKGNSPEEYEDAAAPDTAIEEECAEFVCAIADGATETSFSRLWARLLVCGYRDGKDLSASQEVWEERVSQKSLSWYAEQKAESGAFAALLGLKIKANGTWVVEAIGDCCMVHVRQGNILQTFPLQHSDEFNNNPYLLSSKATSETIQEHLAIQSGAWNPGDRFLLMSDAIACWSFKRQEQHKDALLWLDALRSQSDLDTFAELQRTSIEPDGRPAMRNDDVTLMRILLG